MPSTPSFIAPTQHDDPAQALAQVRRIYSQQVGHLREAVQRFAAGETLPGRVRACYPYVRIDVTTGLRPAATEGQPEAQGLSYGFAAGTGVGHQILNRSNAPLVYLEVGDRTAGDQVQYPEDDLQAIQQPDNSWLFLYKNGEGW